MNQLEKVRYRMRKGRMALPSHVGEGEGWGL